MYVFVIFFFSAFLIPNLNRYFASVIDFNFLTFMDSKKNLINLIDIKIKFLLFSYIK